MNLISVSIVVVLTVIAAVVNKKIGFVPPVIWWISIIACCVVNYRQGGTEMLAEGGIAFAVLFVIVMYILGTDIGPRLLGGGVLKSFPAAAAALGRYIGIEIVLAILASVVFLLIAKATGLLERWEREGRLKKEVLIPLALIVAASYGIRILLHI